MAVAAAAAAGDAAPRKSRAESPAPAACATASSGNGGSSPDKGSETGKPSGEKPTPPTAPGSASLPLWIVMLCISQIAMFIFTKRAVKLASLPLTITCSQFVISAMLTVLVSLLQGRCANMCMNQEQRLVLVPLGAVWAVSFVLLTASVACMSAALAGVVRSMEPLASLILGITAGERYSWRVVATLMPICAGVILASHGGGDLTAAGVTLAILSNFGFCARPFLAQRVKRSVACAELSDTARFLHVMLVAAALLPPAAALAEGWTLPDNMRRLASSGETSQFVADVVFSSVSFFVYQFAQLVVMSRMAPLTFSVLTPLTKASMIVACALYFGDPFGSKNVAGVVISTLGMFAFSAAKSADAARAAASGKSKTS